MRNLKNKLFNQLQYRTLTKELISALNITQLIHCKILKYLLYSQIALILTITSCKQYEQNSKQNFNYNWKFKQGDDSLAYTADYNDTDWRTLNLPHDWSIEGDFSLNNPTLPAGGALPAGIGWYRKSFALETEDENKQIFIDFDGIYRNSEVWINSHYLGKRANGYISFRYELTPYLHFDGSDNILSVKVDNSLQPNSRWYTGSGIYRNTWLVKLPKLHLKHWGVFVTTPQISNKQATIKIDAKLEGNIADYKKLNLKTSIIEPLGEEITKTEHKIEDAAKEFSQEIILSNPQRWSPESPYLYTAHIELFADGKLLQAEDYAFGIREYYFDSDSGFFLNNKKYEIRGVNLHHDLGALGAAVNTRAIERQLELMKGMGVNAIRTAHNPPVPELLDLCDKMGFLVMDEAFDVWKLRKVRYDYNIDWDENHKQDLTDLILRDRNHPCVFMWSIGNEIREQFDSTGITIAKELSKIVKKIDNTRPVTCALTETVPEKNFIYQSKALDVLGFNYKHENWVDFKRNFPGEKMIASENMSAYATRGHYDMPSDKTHYWPKAYGEPIIGANADYTVSAYDMVCAFWGATHEETLKALYTYDFIGGIFIWCGIDFIGEPVPYEWPSKNSYYGIVDLAGFPKDIYYLYQSIWTDKPTLHIFPHWNWKEKQLIDVWAYYNQADEVELFLNGESLGIKKKTGNDMHVMWRVNYKPGTLKAISRKDGETVLEKSIQTAGEPSKILLEADRNTILADGKDLSFVTVKIVDKDGNLVPDANNLIHFNIKGNGFIAGVDNGYQASHEPFKASKRKAFNGLCLAIIQSNGKAGNIELEAVSEGLESSILKIEAK